MPNTTLSKFPTAWSLGRECAQKWTQRTREGGQHVDTGTREKDSLPRSFIQYKKYRYVLCKIQRRDIPLESFSCR